MKSPQMKSPLWKHLYNEDGLYIRIMEDPQAHIDALVEAGVLAKGWMIVNDADSGWEPPSAWMWQRAYRVVQPEPPEPPDPNGRLREIIREEIALHDRKLYEANRQSSTCTDWRQAVEAFNEAIRSLDNDQR